MAALHRFSTFAVVFVCAALLAFMSLHDAKAGDAFLTAPPQQGANDTEYGRAGELLSSFAGRRLSNDDRGAYDAALKKHCSCCQFEDEEVLDGLCCQAEDGSKMCPCEARKHMQWVQAHNLFVNNKPCCTMRMQLFRKDTSICGGATKNKPCCHTQCQHHPPRYWVTATAPDLGPPWYTDLNIQFQLRQCALGNR